MAKKIQANGAYRPKIKAGKTVQKPEFVRYLSDRTGLNEGEINLVLAEQRDAVVFFNRSGGQGERSAFPP